MLGRVTQGGWRLTFRGRQAPQEAGVSVNVFFYLKKVGRQRKEETTESQSENGKKICRFRMCDVQFTSGVELRLKLTKGLGCTDACRGGSTSATPQTVSVISDTTFGGHLHQVRRSQ